MILTSCQGGHGSPILSSLEFLFKMYVMALYESQSLVLNSKLNIRRLQMRPLKQNWIQNPTAAASIAAVM